MRVLRTLESLGAAVMREGAYLLPDTPANRQALEALAEYIAKGAGSAHVLHVARRSPAQHEAFRRLFDRSAHYENLVKTVREPARRLRPLRSERASARVLLKQRRDFEAIAALDFFPTPSKARAQQAIADADHEIRKLYVSRHRPIRPRREAARAHLGDAQAALGRPAGGAWLVRRFVDPEAKLLWLETAARPPPGAIGFGFEGAHFAAGEARVAYEDIVAQLQLGGNAAIAKIGASSISWKARHAGSRGRRRADASARRGAPRTDEAELLAEAEKTFDLLYEAYFEPPKRQRGTHPA